jgi:hypothetical protein
LLRFIAIVLSPMIRAAPLEARNRTAARYILEFITRLPDDVESRAAVGVADRTVLLADEVESDIESAKR